MELIIRKLMKPTPLKLVLNVVREEKPIVNIEGYTFALTVG